MNNELFTNDWQTLKNADIVKAYKSLSKQLIESANTYLKNQKSQNKKSK